jgi:integrase/recombinase XerD
MLKAIEAYLALRRATGFAMLNAECLLKSFATFATERRQTHVHTQTAIDWAARGPSVAQRDARLKAVCRFVRHVRVEDARHELPPVNHFGARKTRRSPHIYSAVEIDRLIEAALRLRPKGGLRSRTYGTLIALLSVTGLRISEALKLTVADVTRDGLLIRETKFRKTRLVPLHDTAVAGLKRYLARRRPRSEAEPVFVDARGLPLRYIAVKETFDRLVGRAGTYWRRSVARVCTICGTRLRCARCKAVQWIEAEAARIWWHLRPTWVTSTSMRPTGTWRPPPTSCATSPRPVKGSSSKGGNHDADCSPHRSVPR